jgi:hypothetical protein
MSTKGSKTHLYDVLEISPGASEQDIKKAYRKLAMVGLFESSFFLIQDAFGCWLEIFTHAAKTLFP